MSYDWAGHGDLAGQWLAVVSDLETVIELDIGGSNEWEKIECIVDTGFPGYLALPNHQFYK